VHLHEIYVRRRESNIEKANMEIANQMEIKILLKKNKYFCIDITRIADIILPMRFNFNFNLSSCTVFKYSITPT